MDQRIDCPLGPLRASVKRQYHRDMESWYRTITASSVGDQMWRMSHPGGHGDCLATIAPMPGRSHPELTRGYPVPYLTCSRITRGG